MSCLFALFGMVFPRVALVALWLFTDWLSAALDHWLLALLGFLFLPYTLLWWTTVVNLFAAQWGFWQVLILVLAVIADLSSYRSARRRKNKS